MIPAWFLFVFLANIVLSISTIIDKHLLKTFHSSAVSFFKMGMNFVLLAVIVVLFFKEYVLVDGWIYYLLLMGLLYGGASLLYMFSMQRGAVSELIPYNFSLNIVISFFAAAFIFKERISAINIIGIVLVFIGIWVILTEKHKFWPKWNFPLFVMTLQVLIMVVYNLVSKYISVKLNPFVISMNMYLFAAFFLILFMVFFNKKDLKLNLRVLVKNRRNLLWLIVGSGLAVVGTTFIYKALSLGDATKVLPVSGMTPFLLVLFGGAFFKETNLVQKIVGSIILFCGIFLIAI